MKDPTIARTIIEQLGNGTLYMLGAKDLLDLGDGLSFRVRGSRRANYVEIRLTPADLYDVSIRKIGRAPSYRVTEVCDAKGIYCDQLHELIERETGLATRLPNVRFV